MPTTNDIYLQRFDGLKWAEKLGIITVTSDDKVGIGTTSPSEKLHIAGAVKVSGDFSNYTASTGTLHFASGKTGLISVGANTSTLGGFRIFSTKSDGSGLFEAITVTPTGYIGFGTTSPTYQLECPTTPYSGTKANWAKLGRIYIAGGSTGSYPDIGYNIHSGPGSYLYDVSDTAAWISIDGNFHFKTAASGTAGNTITATTVFSILTGGNVGIGTTTPNARFDVKGSGTGHVTIGEYTASDAYGAISVAGGILDTANYNFASSPGDTNLFVNRPSTKSIFFRENNADQVVILAGGNFGIGTTSPGAQIQVNCSAAGTIGSIIKGAASQSANLQEWQNSSGTVLAKRDFSGACFQTSSARTSGTASYFTVTTPADTGITAATESIGVNFITGTRTWADGTVTTQREYVFAAPTYNKTTTSATFTHAATLAVTAAPIAGTGVTITNPYAIWVQAGVSRFGGNVAIAASSLSANYQLLVANGTLPTAGLSPITANQAGAVINFTTGTTSGTCVGLAASASSSGVNATTVVGLYGLATTGSGGDAVTDFTAIRGEIGYGPQGGKTFTNMSVLETKLNFHNNTGSVTNTYGLKINTFTAGGSTNTLTNVYGIYIGTVKPSGPTYTNNPYSIYVSDTTARNYFAGSSGFGVTGPTAQIHVQAAAAATIAEIIKGAASQSANLTEWQNSSGTVLAQIDSAGGVYFNKNTGNTSISTSGTDTIIKNNNSSLVRVQTNSGTSLESASGVSHLFSLPGATYVIGSVLYISGDSSATGIKLEQAYATSYYYLTMRHANGGGTCGMKIFAANDMANSAFCRIEITGTAANFVSTSIGTGTTVPIRFLVGSTEVLRMNSAGLISFSGVAATDVALKQSGTQLQVRLGDDSAYGNLQAAEVIFGGGTITATASTLGLFGVTAVAQPTTGITAASFVANTSAIADDTATWDGYTVGQIVAALRTVGLLA